MIDSIVTQIVGGLMLMVGQALVNLILMQRPWNLEGSQFDPSEGFLWLCYHVGTESEEPDVEEKQTSTNEPSMGHDKVQSTPALAGLGERIDRIQEMVLEM